MSEKLRPETTLDVESLFSDALEMKPDKVESYFEFIDWPDKLGARFKRFLPTGFNKLMALVREWGGEYDRDRRQFIIPKPTAKEPTPISPGRARREAGKLFESRATDVLPNLGFKNIRSAKGSEPYDLIADKDGQKCFIEVKGRSVDRSVDETLFLVQYEKLWNLIKIAERGQVYFLFLTRTDSKLIKYEELDSEYFKTHKLRLTIKPSGPLARQIIAAKTRELEGFQTIPIDAILSMPFQSRVEKDEARLTELAETINQYGVLEPVLVQLKPSGLYELVAGQRRVNAAKIAGLIEIPAIVKELSDQEAYECHFIENLQREDLNDYEIGRMLHFILEKFSLTQEALAKRLRKTKGWVSQHISHFDFVEKELKGRGFTAVNKVTEGQTRAIREAPPEKREEILTAVKSTQEVPSWTEIKKFVHPEAETTLPPSQPAEEIPQQPTSPEPKEREVPESKPKPEEIDTGFEWECPECHQKFQLIHVNYPNETVKHKLEAKG